MPVRTGRTGGAPHSLRPLIEQRLKEQWPGGAVPRGAWTRVAREVGVSRQRVFEVAKAMGFHCAPNEPALPYHRRQERSMSMVALEAMQERWPKKDVPVGGFAALSRELGTSPQLISKVARRHGYKAAARGSKDGRTASA